MQTEDNYDLEALRRQVEDQEQSIEKLEEAMNGMAQLLNQMDMFLREMIKLGVFEKAIKELETVKTKLIL
jgi:t-SNARE complex subunit (syntaxin)